MKHFYVLFLFIFAFMFHPSHADEFTTIDHEIEAIRHQVKLHQSSSTDLLILKKKLDAFIPALHQCIVIQNENIAALSSEIEYLKDPEHHHLAQTQKDYDVYLHGIGSNKDKCSFLLVKIENIQQHIYRINANSFNKNLFVQQKPFWSIISGLKDFSYPYLQPGFIFEILKNETAFFRTSKVNIFFYLHLLL
ncbi:MAG: hypothetical protein EBY16_06230, partial [Gammaproteobacteria bacterium]|nr:hypothetical protein [Gammaproteobacteria bacterium]